MPAAMMSGALILLEDVANDDTSPVPDETIQERFKRAWKFLRLYCNSNKQCDKQWLLDLHTSLTRETLVSRGCDFEPFH